jgi:hypothetical protein
VQECTPPCPEANGGGGGSDSDKTAAACASREPEAASHDTALHPIEFYHLVPVFPSLDTCACPDGADDSTADLAVMSGVADELNRLLTDYVTKKERKKTPYVPFLETEW